MIVLDLYAMLGGEGLEGAFGGDCFNERIINLGMDVPQSTVVVDEDSSAAIVLLGEFSF